MPILTYHNGRLRFEYSNNGTFAVGGVSMKIHGLRGERERKREREREKEGTGEGQWNRAPSFSSEKAEKINSIR